MKALRTMAIAIAVFVSSGAMAQGVIVNQNDGTSTKVSVDDLKDIMFTEDPVVTSASSSADILELKDDINKIKAYHNSDIDMLRSSINNVESSVSVLQMELARLNVIHQDDVNALKAEQAAINVSITEHSKNMAKMEDDVAKLNVEQSDLNYQIKILNDQISRLLLEIDDLKNRVSTLENR